jgi:hypothetical protein
MIPMDMMKTTINQIIHMVTMWYHFMTTIIPMPASAKQRFTFCRVHFTYGNFAFVLMSVMFMVKMTIVNIINMISVSYFCMSASYAMPVGMPFMNTMFHIYPPFRLLVTSLPSLSDLAF